MSKPFCNVDEVAGIIPALKGMKFPTQSPSDSHTMDDGKIVIGLKDHIRAHSLISKGPVHGKFQRGIMAWLHYEMPRYIHSELDTYTVGVSPISSESTMYTLMKQTKIDYDEFVDYFTTGTDACVIEFYYRYAESIRDQLAVNHIDRDVAVWKLKQALPEGWIQGREKVFSYQALRNLYKYRKKHRLPEWQLICDCIERLPYAEELLFGMSVEKFIETECDPVDGDIRWDSDDEDFPL